MITSKNTIKTISINADGNGDTANTNSLQFGSANSTSMIRNQGQYTPFAEGLFIDFDKTRTDGLEQTFELKTKNLTGNIVIGSTITAEDFEQWKNLKDKIKFNATLAGNFTGNFSNTGSIATLTFTRRNAKL